MARHLTSADAEAYGYELLDMSQRAALDAVAPQLQELKFRQQQIAAREQKLQNQLVLDALDRELGQAWRTTNVDENFKAWVASTIYPLSGRSFHHMMLDAFATGNVAPIAAVFRRYWQESGQTPAAAGRAQASTSRSSSGRFAGQVTPKMIESLYERIRKQGRTPALDAEEKALHAALHNQR